MNIKSILRICAFLFFVTVNMQGFCAKKEEALSVQECFGSAMESLEEKNWKTLLHHAQILVKNFPTTPFAQEAQYLLGVSYYNLAEYELADAQFSKYLKNQVTPKHFEKAIEYKFAIAELYKAGAKKHLMGFETLPKWVPARQDAIHIYEEVITALPHHDLGAKALHGKAVLLAKDEQFKESVETYQTLIRRFPKHPLSAESYVGIGKVYLSQCKEEYPDPDFLDLAIINLRKFKIDFPSDEKIALAEKNLLEMKEIYAESLYSTAQFYERTKKPSASLIYYSQLIAKYPETKLAALSTERLNVLIPKVKKDKHASQDIVTRIGEDKNAEGELKKLEGDEISVSRDVGGQPSAH